MLSPPCPKIPANGASGVDPKSLCGHSEWYGHVGLVAQRDRGMRHTEIQIGRCFHPCSAEMLPLRVVGG